MKLNCNKCKLEMTPYVTPHESNWKADCSVCGEFIKIIPDSQLDDEYLAWALARRSPRNLKERLWLVARKLLPTKNRGYGQTRPR